MCFAGVEMVVRTPYMLEMIEKSKYLYSSGRAAMMSYRGVA